MSRNRLFHVCATSAARFCVALLVVASLSGCRHRHYRDLPDGTADLSGQQARRERHVDDGRRSGRRMRHGTQVRMEENGGVYLVPITVNGLPLKFIFDTGASSISISSAEAAVMVRQGKIAESDIVGQQRFQDATGGVSEGTVVMLRTVEIGGVVLHDVEASVVDNMSAPLLLGQSALAKFGKISIDYDNLTISFE